MQDIGPDLTAPFCFLIFAAQFGSFCFFFLLFDLHQAALEHLERALVADHRVARQVDHAHATLPQLLVEGVLAELHLPADLIKLLFVGEKGFHNIGIEVAPLLANDDRHRFFVAIGFLVTASRGEGIVDVGQLLDDVAADARVVQPARPITVDIPAPVDISADPDRLLQAVSILVTNALTHTPASAALSLGAETDGETTVLITLASPKPGYVRQAFADVPIIPQHIWKDIPEKADVSDPMNFANEKPIGSGPFKFDYWDRGRELKVTAFKEHFSAPKCAGIIRIAYGSHDAMAAAIEKGECEYEDRDKTPSGVYRD